MIQRIRFLSAKLNPPVPSSYALVRNDLDFRSVIHSCAKCVLLGAPAGFGKTTVMLQWLGQLAKENITTGWLGLDEQDNDISRFLTYLNVACRRLSKLDDALVSSSSMFDSQIVPSGLVNEIMAQLCQIVEPFVLFVDDYEVIHNVGIHDTMRQIINILPANSLLVIGTRAIPPLGIARLRAREQLIDVGIEQLRFSSEETTQYLRDKRKLQIGMSEISDLYRCTEGWPAALQLASISLDGHKNIRDLVRNFSGSQANIADYLAEDAFSHQPEDIQQFLLSTSILSIFDLSLCEAVTGRPDCAELLDRIEKANLFLIPLDGARQYYRYHGLFSEFLQAQLRKRHPTIIEALHRKASDGYLALGRIVQAVEHAISSGDNDLVSQLVDAYAGTLLYSGRVDTLTRWVESLPAGKLQTRPRLRLTYAWMLAAQHRYQEAKQTVEDLRASEEPTLDSTARDEILALGPIIQMYSDRIDECEQSSEENFTKLSGSGEFAIGTLYNIRGYCQITTGKFDQAREFLGTAKRLFLRIGGYWGSTYAECWEGVILLSQGRVRNALPVFQSAFEQATGNGQYSSASAVAASYLAETLYELDDIAAAEELLADYIPLVEQTGLPDHIISSIRIQARILFLRNDHEGAQRRLDDMERLGIMRDAPRVIVSSQLEKARFAMLIGDLELARSLLKAVRKKAPWLGFGNRIYAANELDDLVTNEVRLLNLSNRARDAIAPLKTEIRSAENNKRVRRILLLKMLLAKATDQAGEQNNAMRLLKETLSDLAERGYVRMVKDEWEFLAPLTAKIGFHLGDLPARRNGEPGATSFPADAEVGIDLADGAKTAQSFPAMESLSTRESQVLQLLANGFSNRGIADSLFVSEATVKTHLRNINAKLGTHSRTQAISIARKRNLI